MTTQEQILENIDNLFTNTKGFDKFFMSNRNFYFTTHQKNCLCLDSSTLNDKTINKIGNDVLYANKFLRWIAEFLNKNSFAPTYILIYGSIGIFEENNLPFERLFDIKILLK